MSGIIAGLLGVGGGVIWCLYCFRHLFGSTFRRICTFMAVGTSLAIICFTGGQSARSHLKRGAVDNES